MLQDFVTTALCGGSLKGRFAFRKIGIAIAPLTVGRCDFQFTPPSHRTEVNYSCAAGSQYLKYLARAAAVRPLPSARVALIGGGEAQCPRVQKRLFDSSRFEARAERRRRWSVGVEEGAGERQTLRHSRNIHYPSKLCLGLRKSD